MAKIALILAGSGVMDGSEIHEATLTLYFLAKLGAVVQCFAPDRTQLHVVNHINNTSDSAQQRNVWVESARIARGEVKPLTSLKVAEFDAIVIPGGFGVAKNLCNYAEAGVDFEVAEDMKAVIEEAHRQHKLLGLMCIAPILVARLIPGVTVTVGQSNDTAEHIATWGAIHRVASVAEVVWDPQHRVATTPAYMLGTNIAEVAVGIEALCTLLMQQLTESCAD